MSPLVRTMDGLIILFSLMCCSTDSCDMKHKESHRNSKTFQRTITYLGSAVHVIIIQVDSGAVLVDGRLGGDAVRKLVKSGSDSNIDTLHLNGRSLSGQQFQ
jgi:hypothetical protein